MTTSALAAVASCAVPPCPGCGAGEARTFLVGPAQLMDSQQRFTFVRCTDCDLVYLRDRVQPGDEAGLYDDDYPLHRGPALWGPFAPFVTRDLRRTDGRRVERVLAARPLGPSDRVLDVGCGRPSFLAALAERTGCAGHGLDVVASGSEPAFAHLHIHERAPPGFPPALSERAPFSVVTFWHSLEHEDAPLETLRWVREHLAPDGVVIIEVPDLDGRTARWLKSRWPGFHTPRHASVFTPRTLAALVERAGLSRRQHERRGTLSPFLLCALGTLDAVGFRFSRHRASLVFPLWALGMALSWPWLRVGRTGMGLQLLVAERAQTQGTHALRSAP